MFSKLNNKTNNIYLELMKSKKYIFLLLIILVLINLSLLSIENYLNPLKEIIGFIILFIIGTALILYSSKKDKEIHKIAFAIILIIGIICVFITPTLIVCDEPEHFIRANMVSDGILLPEFIPNTPDNYLEGYNGYYITKSCEELNNLDNWGFTFLDSPLNNKKITYTESITSSCFAQNPFYTYLIPAIGILLAKILDLPIIWTVWLGRLFNLIGYAILCRIAIKKAPVYKIPLLVISCFPLCIYSAASLSADALINGLIILSFAYLIYMYKSPAESIDKKDLTIFFISILMIGFIKVPYVLLSFLIFLVKKEQFKTKNLFIISRILPIVILGICCLWSFKYSSKTLVNSCRLQHFNEVNVNSTLQMQSMFNHPLDTLYMYSQIIYLTLNLMQNVYLISYMVWINNSILLSILYSIMFIIFIFTYENEMKLKNRERAFGLIVFIIIYLGIITVGYLSWAGLNTFNLSVDNIGIYLRYLIPILPILPMICSLNLIKNNKNTNMWIITNVIVFIFPIILLTLTQFYY